MSALPGVLELGGAGEPEPDTHDDGEGKRPHDYRCDGCLKHSVCWNCGSSIRTGRCTNAACMRCHLAAKCGGHARAA